MYRKGCQNWQPFIKKKKMKIIIFSITLLVLIFLVGKAFTAKAKTEMQKYKTIVKNGDFEIRFYPEAILATVEMNGNYDNSRIEGFRVLANYIFGGNHENKSIAMTSPVRMSNNQELNSMSFIMPAEIQFDNLPKPFNDNIKLHYSKAGYAASIRFSGFANSEKISEKEKELAQILANLGVEHQNQFEFLGYNPPYQFVNRRNEVLVYLSDFNPNSIDLEKVQTEQ